MYSTMGQFVVKYVLIVKTLAIIRKSVAAKGHKYAVFKNCHHIFLQYLHSNLQPILGEPLFTIVLILCPNRFLMPSPFLKITQRRYIFLLNVIATGFSSHFTEKKEKCGILQIGRGTELDVFIRTGSIQSSVRPKSKFRLRQINVPQKRNKNHNFLL